MLHSVGQTAAIHCPPGDVTAPTITSSATASVAENVTLAHSLTANETVSWSIVGGADQARFEVSGSTLRWLSNGTKDFEAPNDADTDNDYVVQVRATDPSSNFTNQTITVTVTDSAGSWVDSFIQTLNADSAGWSGFNLRQVILAAAMTQSGSKFRLTLEASSAGGCSIDGVYAGHAAEAGDAFDFDGTQVAVTVAASPTFIITAGNSVVTDEITYVVDESKNFIVAIHFDTTSAVRGRSSVANVNSYFKSAANETATSDVSTYTPNTSGTLRLLARVEVLQGA